MSRGWMRTRKIEGSGIRSPGEQLERKVWIEVRKEGARDVQGGRMSESPVQEEQPTTPEGPAHRTREEGNPPERATQLSPVRHTPKTSHHPGKVSSEEHQRKEKGKRGEEIQKIPVHHMPERSDHTEPALSGEGWTEPREDPGEVWYG